MSLYNSIATSYAFMVPQVLSALTLNIRGIAPGGEIEYDHHSMQKKGPVISPGVTIVLFVCGKLITVSKKLSLWSRSFL